MAGKGLAVALMSVNPRYVESSRGGFECKAWARSRPFCTLETTYVHFELSFAHQPRSHLPTQASPGCWNVLPVSSHCSDLGLLYDGKLTLRKSNQSPCSQQATFCLLFSTHDSTDRLPR